MTSVNTSAPSEGNYSFLLKIFIGLSILNIFFENIDMVYGVYLTKPLLLITLSCWFWLNTRKNATAFSRFLLAGLIFSIGGDTFLMFVENAGKASFFVFGLGCFLLAHLSYLLAFLKYSSSQQGILSQKPLLILFFIAFFVGNIVCL